MQMFGPGRGHTDLDEPRTHNDAQATKGGHRASKVTLWGKGTGILTTSFPGGSSYHAEVEAWSSAPWALEEERVRNSELRGRAGEGDGSRCRAWGSGGRDPT